MTPRLKQILSMIILTAPFVVAFVLFANEEILGFSLAMAFGICAVTTCFLFAKSRGFASLGRKIFFRISMILLMIPLFGVLVIFFSVGRSSGDYRCRICGKQIDRLEYFDAVLREGPPQSAYQTGTEYEQWYWKNVAVEHPHDWGSIGCHFGGGAIGCSFEGIGSGFYLFMPRFPDQELAVAKARRIATSSSNARIHLLEAFPERRIDGNVYPAEMSINKIIAEGGSPWGRILADKQLTREQFKAYYELWLNHHPEWR